MSNVKQGDGDGGEGEALADAAAFLLAGRPERVEDGILLTVPAEQRVAIGGVRELLSTLGRAEAPVRPSDGLRGRILETLAARKVRRALLVIDMINDHLEPGSLLEVPRAREVVPALEARLAAARAAGVPIVYVVDEHEIDDPDLDAWGTHAAKGTRGTEVWSAIAPQPGDRVVKKPSYSAFYESSLEGVLQELAVDTLVLTGCLTEIGVMATATDAMQRGFAVEVPPDTQAGSAAELEAAALGTMGVMVPFGPSRKKLLAELDARAA